MCGVPHIPCNILKQIDLKFTSIYNSVSELRILATQLAADSSLQFTFGEPKECFRYASLIEHTAFAGFL